METAYWIPSIGSLQDWFRTSYRDRAVIRYKLMELTKSVRQGGTITGHPRTDRKL